MKNNRTILSEHSKSNNCKAPFPSDRDVESVPIAAPWFIGGMFGATQAAKTISNNTKRKLAAEQESTPEWSKELREQLKSDRLGQIALEKFDLENKGAAPEAEKNLKRLVSEVRVFRNSGFGDLIMAFYDMRGQVEKAGVKLSPLVGLASSSYMMYLLGFIEENPSDQGIDFEFGGEV